MTLGEIVTQNIFAIRKDKKLSQTVLAKKTGLSVSYVSMLERGLRTPPLWTLEVFAKALGVNPLRLMEEPSPRSSRARRR